MLRKLLKNTKFLKIIKKYLKDAEIVDILLFGSITRGKEKLRDIDILIIFISKENLETEFKLRRELKNIGLNIHITGKGYNELFSSSFLAKESILTEGYSMKQKKFLAESFGYLSFILFKYFLKGMSKSTRMRFYYSLYGRGKDKGILVKFNSYKFSDSVLLVPFEKTEEIKRFLDSWSIKYLEVPVLIPKRIVNYKIFIEK